MSGARLNNGERFDSAPCFAPAKANTKTKPRNKKVVPFRNRALASMPLQFSQVSSTVMTSPSAICGR